MIFCNKSYEDNMQSTPIAGKHDSRSGVALIITIGMLSLLLLLVFSFMVSMHTERSAAQAATDGARARQTILSSLHRAAADIRGRASGQEIDDEAATPEMAFVPYPPRPFRSQYIRGHTARPTSSPNTWVPYGSYGFSDLSSARVEGMYESHAELIPGPLRSEVRDFSRQHAWWHTQYGIGWNLGYLDRACTQSVIVRQVLYTPHIYSVININCSGLLDPIPLTGGEVDRRYGTNVNEIAITTDMIPDPSLLGTAPGLSPGDLPLVETWQEMADKLRIQNEETAYFYPFSHFPVGQYIKRNWGQTYQQAPPTDTVDPWERVARSLTPAVYLGGTPTTWPSDERIKLAFIDAFHPAFGELLDLEDNNEERQRFEQKLDWLVAGLKDYVDEDYIPTNLEYPTVEPVAMINEIVFECLFTFSADNETNYTMNVEIIGNIELWNPYIWDPSTGTPGAPGNLDEMIELEYELESEWSIAIVINGAEVENDVMEFEAEAEIAARGFYVQSSEPLLFEEIDIENFDSLNVTIRVQNEDTLLSARQMGNTGINRTIGQLNQENAVELNITGITPPNAGSTNTVRRWIIMETLDPRFHYDMDNPDYWRVTFATNAHHTLNNINHWTIEYLSQATNLTDGAWNINDDTFHEHYTYMYTANKPLRTIGELAYLPYAPWKTLRLFPHPAGIDGDGNVAPEAALHRIIDVFTLIDTNSAAFDGMQQPAVKGMINPNSPYSPVFAAAFLNMPIDLHPDQSAEDYTVVNAGLARDIADAIVNHTGTRTNYRFDFAGNIYDALLYNHFIETSEIGMVAGLFNDNIDGLRELPLFKKEALLRNSAGLFNTRQLLIMTIMASSYVRAAHEFEAGPAGYDWHYFVNIDGIRTAERRAMALTWIDPWTGRTALRQFIYTNPVYD